MPITPRVCSCGCGMPLLVKDGSPDFSKRRFYSAECKSKDKVSRIALGREKRKKKSVAAAHPIWLRIAGEPVLLQTPQAVVDAFLKLTILEKVEVLKQPRARRPRKSLRSQQSNAVNSQEEVSK
jgi:hypothetical protein